MNAGLARQKNAWPHYAGYEEHIDELGEPSEAKEPLWSLRLVLTKGLGERTLIFYHQMRDGPQGSIWSLMEWFEAGEGDFDDDNPIED